MAGSMAADARFALATNPQGADVTDAAGVARFTVTIPGPDWELAFHTQAPTADVDLYSGTGVQGQVTWSGPPQSATVHRVVAAPAMGQFVVRKALDASDVQGDRDMSGFVFAVEASGSTPALVTTVTTVTTLADGRTPPIDADRRRLPHRGSRPTRVGRRAHRRRPHRRPVRTDGRRTSRRNRGADAEFVYTYTNIVPTPSISTRASDAADGDKFIDRGARDQATGETSDMATTATTASTSTTAAIIDTVSYRGLVPGTVYIARGELVIRDELVLPVVPDTTGNTTGNR